LTHHLLQPRCPSESVARDEGCATHSVGAV
jgi:hypothetical protein